MIPASENLLCFIQISDTHINPDGSYNNEYATYTPVVGIEALIRELNALPFRPDFILHTGDIAYDPDAEVYPAIRTMLSQIDVPIYYLAGNHDDARAIQTVLMGKARAEAYLYYDFEIKGVHFVCLDSNGPHEANNPSGTVTQEQLDWLDSICRSDDPRPLVIAVHHNVLPVHVPWLDNWMRMENGEEFHAIVRQASQRLCGVFYGHIHQNYQILREGVLYVSSGSSWCQYISYPIPENKRFIHDKEALPNFNVVTISEGTTAIRRHNFSVD